MNYKLHPRCLATAYELNSLWGMTLVRAHVTDNECADPIPITVDCTIRPTDVAELSPDEQLAMAAVMHYIHEAGEHITFDSGFTINQHDPQGARNMVRLLQRITAGYRSALER